MKKIINALISDKSQDKVYISEIEFDAKIRKVKKGKEFSSNPETIVLQTKKYKKSHKRKSFSSEIIDANYNLLIPAAIDPHVHFDEPGFEFREDFYTGTLSAAFGGITTVIDMPCTSIPPVTNKTNLDYKVKVISKHAVVDFALWGGVSGTSFDRGEDIERNMKELADAGVVGFKTYLISGMEKFTSLNFEQLKLVGKIAKKLGLPVAVHAEDKKEVEKNRNKFQAENRTDIKSYCQTRSIKAEVEGIKTVIRAAKESGGKFHVVHITSKKGLQLIQDTKKKGVRVTTETCPHFLAFNQSDFERIGSFLKTAPAVKKEEDRKYLWKGLKNGSINFICTDHAGCNPAKEKNTGNIWTDYGGIPGTELMVPYIFSEGYLKGKISLKRTIEIISTNAAKFYDLYPQKGSLQIGTDADFAIVNLTEKQKIKGKNLHCKGKYTPFENETFHAKIDKTFCRGELIIMSHEKLQNHTKGLGNLANLCR